MEKYYILAIGGSGALASESLVHLCAAGTIKNCEINILVIDPDQTNENVQRLQQTVLSYEAIRNSINQKDPYFFNSKIKFLKVWNPNSGEDSNLENGISYVQYNNENNIRYKILTNLLFSEDKRKEPLHKGYKGNPMIGTIFMKDIEEDEIYKDIAAEERLNLYVFGSLFGGTGAAGLPVMGKSFKETRASRSGATNIGACILLPYFNIKEASEQKKNEFKKNGVNLLPESKNFLPAVKFAIPFYISKHQGKNNGYDAIYYIGCPDSFVNSQLDFGIGGVEQKNHSHYINLFAASGFIDFINKKSDFKKNNDTVFLATKIDLKSSSLNYNNLPLCLNEEQEKNLESFYVSALFFEKYLLGKGRNQYIPWMENKSPKGIGLSKDHLNTRFSDNLKIYFNKYLLWLGQIKSNNYSLELFNTSFYDAEHDNLDLEKYEEEIISRYRLGRENPKKGIFQKTIKFQDLDEYFNKVVSDIEQTEDNQKFIDILRYGSFNFISKYYSKVK